MTRGSFISIAAFAATTFVALCHPTAAGEWSFDLPQLVGNYLGDTPASPTLEVLVDLGLPFAEISGASLRVSGRHAPGVHGELNGGGPFHIPAEMLAYLPDQPFLSAYVDTLLPMPAGAFELESPFRASGPPGPRPPDLAAWLDGLAEFRFTLASPPTIATMYLIDPPAVTIDSATLVISGQPRLDEFMLTADFDFDGDVDGDDLRQWQDSADAQGGADGAGFLDWQRQLGAGVGGAAPSTAAAIPEPASLALALGLVAVAARRPRRPTSRRAGSS